MLTLEPIYYALSLITSITLIFSMWKDRSLLIKPTFFFVLSFNVMIQWGATIEFEEMNDYLPEPFVFFLLTQLFPVICLLIALNTRRNEARGVWFRLQNPSETDRKQRVRIGWTLAVSIVAASIYYFAIVPFRGTGLYAILYDPTIADLARANSMTEVPDPILRYSFSVLTSTLAPISAVVLGSSIGRSFKMHNYLKTLASSVLDSGVDSACECNWGSWIFRHRDFDNPPCTVHKKGGTD